MGNLNINFVEPKTEKSNITILKNHAKIRKNIKTCENMLKINPNDVDKLWELAGFYIDIQEYRKAINCFNKLKILTPNNGNVFYLLGHLYSIMRDFSKAIITFEKSIDLDTSYGDAYYRLGLIYAGSEENYQKVIVILKKGIEKSPNNKDLIETLIQMYLLTLQYEEITPYLDMLQDIDSTTNL